MYRCPNCGAPVKGHKCDYCGTIIFDFATIEVDKPFWISIKAPGGQIMLARVVLERFEIENPRTSWDTVYADNEVVARVSNHEPPRLIMEFVEVENQDKIMHFISEYLSASSTDVGDLDVE